VARAQVLAIRRDLVGEPRDAVRRVIEHASSQAGFLDRAVPVEHGAGPAQVDLARPHRPAAGDDAGVGREVGDGVEHLARRFRLAVELLDARVDDLDGGHHDLGRGQHVGERRLGAFERPREHERELDLDPGRDEAVDWNVAAGIEEHVVEQRREVGLADLRGLLHGARREPDLATAHDAAFGEL